ncbi:unnamed protein product [Ectocarpus sp. 12 AP-2014]
MATAKRTKRNEVVGSTIKYDDKTQCYKRSGKFVNFGIGDSRVYDVGEVFLKHHVIFGVITETPRALTLDSPSSNGDSDFEKNIGLVWALSRVDHVFSKNCTSENLAMVIKACSGQDCASSCLRGIIYTNQFGAECVIHLSGKVMKDVCRIMGQEASDLHVRAADLLNETYRGHRSNGDSVIPVSAIRANDMPAFKMMYREKIVMSQKVGNKEFLITREVSEAEELFKASLAHLKLNFSVESRIEIANDTDSAEQLIEEQLSACNIAMNNGVSYICGMPGVGKTSSLCKVIKNSRGTIILTPSHVAREVVHQRAKKNLSPESTFSVEVLAFGIRHIHTWHPDADKFRIKPSDRSCQLMEKFQDSNGNIQVETLIMEETSMADIFQTSAVLAALCKFPSFKRVVFCGDHNQLESISKGSVRRDVMGSTSVPGTVLRINHRSKSGLSDNLPRIITSSLAFMEEDETFEIREYGIDECHVETDKFNRRRVVIRDPVIRLFLEHVESGIPCHVFAHTNIEVKQLNSGIKLALFGDDSGLFPPGCKVRVKDCDAISPAVFHHNDFLEVVEVRGSGEYLVKRWSDSYPYPKLTAIKLEGRVRDALDLGFASTIFSFQGSEVDNVICHTVPNSAYFHRNALFTGVSRARKKAYIVGVKDDACSWKKGLYKKAVPRISNLSKMI